VINPEIVNIQRNLASSSLAAISRAIEAGAMPQRRFVGSSIPLEFEYTPQHRIQGSTQEDHAAQCGQRLSRIVYRNIWSQKELCPSATQLAQFVLTPVAELS
jgi:hypothetical protein